MLAIVFSFEFCEKIHSGVPAEGFGIMPNSCRLLFQGEN